MSTENQLVYRHDGIIRGFNKSLDFENYSINGNCSGSLNKLTFTLDNNSGFSLPSSYFTDSANAQDSSKVPIALFYPPPKYNNILQIISSPYEENSFYMLVESGDICKYKLDKDTGIITDQIKVENISDADTHQLC